MTNLIPNDSTLYQNYLEVLKSRIFKILPLIEEENAGVCQYIESLNFELYGLQHVVEGVYHSSKYISLLSSLESLLDEVVVNDRDLKFIRSEIFKMIGIVEKLKLKGE